MAKHRKRKANGQYAKSTKKKTKNRSRKRGSGRVRLFTARSRGARLTTGGLTKTQKKKLHSYCRRLTGIMKASNAVKGKRIPYGSPGWGTVSRYGSRAQQPEMPMPSLISLGV